MDAAYPGLEAPGTDEARPAFHGGAGAMTPTVAKGTILTILTLGIYRFWYTTNVRRFLWNNTEVDGDGLEYTGRGVELFLGFLIAMAVIVPFNMTVGVLSFLAGPAAPVVQPILSLGIVVLAQYALYRARRYRLTRTIWRGIRFQQTGSGWTYAWRSLGWGFLALLTLGLTYPLMRARLERYKMNNTWFGDQKARFSATAGGLFRRGIAFWALGWILVVGPLAALGYVAYAIDNDLMPPLESSWRNWAAGGGLVALSILSFFALLSLYQAVEFRWWADGCSMGEARMSCDLGLFAFLGVYVGFTLVVALLLGGLALLGFAAAEAIGPDSFKRGQPGVMILGVSAYLLAAILISAAWQIFGVRRLWKRSFEGVAITGVAAVLAAQSLTPEGNAFGEGVADALDFGGL